jgi:hypothetical protein
MKPQGTVSLPEMRVLYRGYKNLVEAVASGYDQTTISGAGVSLTKSGFQWIATPGSGSECSISVFGKSSVTNKSVNLGNFKFKIKKMPTAKITWGKFGTGDKATNRDGKILNAGYDESIPLNASFKVDKWILNVGSKSASGVGNKLSNEAMAILRSAAPGSMASFSCIYSGTGTGGTPADLNVKL